jgi:geranylgeranyl pyrophosphate synthase
MAYSLQTYRALFDEELGVSLPDETDLRRLLALKFGLSVDDLLQPALLEPIRDLLGRQGKGIRGKLVGLGFELFNGKHASLAFRRQTKLCKDIIELIHAGSLVVDDIQDGSKMRRGLPALHRRYGIPVALNAGNWLYFWPLELVRDLGLPRDRERLLLRHYRETLLRAHFGQALDVGVRIDSVAQSRLPGVCLAAMELKTGALIAFALVLGALVGGASEEEISPLEEFGRGFGVALQMFDDLGNLRSRSSPSKRFEDLALRRPSWVWACAAKECDGDAYGEFLAAVRKLPERRLLQNWLGRSGLASKARAEAQEHLARVSRRLEADLARGSCDRGSLSKLRALGLAVSESYG